LAELDLIKRYDITNERRSAPLFPKKHLFLQFKYRKKNKAIINVIEISVKIPLYKKIEKINMEYKPD
jgi:hypothetical protein